jgi:origin recognition complex subunit 2
MKHACESGLWRRARRERTGLKSHVVRGNLFREVTMPKRQHDGDGGNTPTPKKLRRTALEDDIVPSPAETPSKRKSILRGTPVKANGTTRDAAPTPTPLKKVLFSTPKKNHPEDDEGYETPTAARNDRSARRKSASALQGPFIDNSDVEEDTTDARIAAEILDSEDEGGDESAEETIGVSNAPKAPDTPSKTGKPRGRPKGKRRDRTPTPPPDLPPHETYFFQNRAGGNKTSTNALPSHLLLDHDDYRTHIQAFKDPHESDMRRLKQLHQRGFDQWTFELEQGFNLCLYGYGSKRNLAMSFAEHIYQHAEKTPKILIINGYTPGLTIRDVLTTVASQMLPKTLKLPAQPTATLDLIFESLTERPSTHLTLIIHSIDHPNLRKSQPLLARLASNPSISLLATCDSPNFALLWDISLTRQLRFLYHDATTFEPYTAELDVVEDVNTLLGRSGRRLGGKDGVRSQIPPGERAKPLPHSRRRATRARRCRRRSRSRLCRNASLLRRHRLRLHPRRVRRRNRSARRLTNPSRPRQRAAREESQSQENCAQTYREQYCCRSRRGVPHAVPRSGGRIRVLERGEFPHAAERVPRPSDGGGAERRDGDGEVERAVWAGGVGGDVGGFGLSS